MLQLLLFPSTLLPSGDLALPIHPSALHAPSAGHDSRHYINIGAGLTTVSDSDGPGKEIDFDEGYAVPIALGWHLTRPQDGSPHWDLELEGIYTDYDAEESGVLDPVRDVTTAALLLNGGIEAPISENWSFYGAAGIGLGWLDLGTNDDQAFDFEDEDGPFLAWQAKAGVRVHASHHVSWNVGYRFFNLDNVEIDENAPEDLRFELETEQHVLEFGVRFEL